LAGAVRTEQAEDLAALDAEIDAIDGVEAFAPIGLASQPLPEGPPAALEDLHEAARVDRGLRGRRGHSTTISTRSSSSAMSPILPGKSTVRSSSSRSTP